jgi:hypothetical protein
MRVLLDLWYVPGRPWAERVQQIVRGRPQAQQIQQIICACPGVRQVDVFPDVGQAEVELADEDPALQQSLVRALEEAGVGVRATCLPSSQEASDYARYYYAARDSSEAHWVD